MTRVPARAMGQSMEEVEREGMEFVASPAVFFRWPGPAIRQGRSNAGDRLLFRFPRGFPPRRVSCGGGKLSPFTLEGLRSVHPLIRPRFARHLLPQGRRERCLSASANL